MKDQPNSISDFDSKIKNTRAQYKAAYQALRVFYRACGKGTYTEQQLMNYKLDLWFMYGKHLDLVWGHHFALKVSQTTGIGSWHGWHNAQRLHTYAPDWQAFYCRCVIPF